MRDATPTGLYWDLVDASSPSNQDVTVRFGIRRDTFQRVLEFRLATLVAQYYGIVQNGLIGAAHLFKGLKRPLLHDGNIDGDQNVLIYSWRPRFDWEWTGGRHDGQPRPLDPPPRRAFVVLVRQEPTQDEHQVVGSIEHWNWVEEQSERKGAPIDSATRYTEHLWSRRTL